MNEEKLFHINISRAQGAEYALLPGDPGRVPLIAGFLENSSPLAVNREFTSYSGTLCGERVIVMSTGIGGASAAIALEELYMAGVRTVIRIGTCGGMQEKVIPGDVIIPTAAVRMEGTSKEYAPIEFPASASYKVVSALVRAAEKLVNRYHTGVIQSKDSFYGQHSPASMPTERELLYKWESWKRLGVLASEMESAALFTVAAVRGIRIGSVLHALWNQERKALGHNDSDVTDVTAAVRVAVEALGCLIAEDKNRQPVYGFTGNDVQKPVSDVQDNNAAVSAEVPEITVSPEKNSADINITNITAGKSYSSAKKKRLIAVVGPTASGKTALAVSLAKKYNGEVISADSMQIYKGMDIVSAKPTEEEKQGVVHHLMGFLSPSDTFSVSDFVELAGKTIDDILSRGKLPILCGGTGLYVRSLIENINFPPEEPDEGLRRELNERFEKEGGQVLLDELAGFDPEAAERIDPNNGKRIIRAIEIYRTTGITMSEHIKNSKLEPSPYDLTAIGLTFADRQNLYDRINKRVDIMIQSGLLEEAKEFYSSEKGVTASAAIGYKELKPYLDGKVSLEVALEKLKMETRRFAKRQLTWFNRDEYIHWIEVDKCPDVLSAAERLIEGNS